MKFDSALNNRRITIPMKEWRTRNMKDAELMVLSIHGVLFSAKVSTENKANVPQVLIDLFELEDRVSVDLLQVMHDKNDVPETHPDAMVTYHKPFTLPKEIVQEYELVPGDVISFETNGLPDVRKTYRTGGSVGTTIPTRIARFLEIETGDKVGVTMANVFHQKR